MFKKVSREQFKNFILKEVSSSLTLLHRIKILVNRAIAIAESSEQREHIYQVAGDIIVDLPKKLNDLESFLTKILYFMNLYMKKDLRTFITIEDRAEVDDIVKSSQKIENSEEVEDEEKNF